MTEFKRIVVLSEKLAKHILASKHDVIVYDEYEHGWVIDQFEEDVDFVVTEERILSKIQSIVPHHPDGDPVVEIQLLYTPEGATESWDKTFEIGEVVSIQHKVSIIEMKQLKADAYLGRAIRQSDEDDYSWTDEDEEDEIS